MTAIEPTVDVSDVDVRALLVDELMKVNRKAMRCPRHWVGRLEAMHAVMDALVDQILELDADPRPARPPVSPPPSRLPT